MNVHISYKVPKTSDLENQINQQIKKLERYLQVFRTGLVHLKGVISENTAREGIGVSLNLRLPSGQMTAQETSTNVSAAIKVAFDSIAAQLKKHKELLRNHHKWPRRRGPSRTVLERVPFEKTVAAVKPETASMTEVSAYLDLNLPRLQRFLERELLYRESLGELRPAQLAVEDVVGETIAVALSDQVKKPEKMKLEPWLYRLAVRAIDRIAAQDRDEGNIPLERSEREQNVRATDEAVLQFHQPDETLNAENIIPDTTAQNPEELAARRELINLVESTLRDAGRHEREAFILFTIEGFTIPEIADITSRSPEEVRASIAKARAHLQYALPIKDPLKDKLVEYSKTA